MGKLKIPPKLEFKGRDDAWYDVSIHLAGSQLKLHYERFQEDDSYEMLPVEDFKTAEDVKLRFRMASKQLQDQHCSHLKERMGVCASSSSDAKNNRFFDAIVEQVFRTEHHLVDGKDQCTCTFRVLWLAGPNANKRTIISSYNICLLTAGNIETHPVINDFVNLVKEKIYSSSSLIRPVWRGFEPSQKSPGFQSEDQMGTKSHTDQLPYFEKVYSRKRSRTCRIPFERKNNITARERDTVDLKHNQAERLETTKEGTKNSQHESLQVDSTEDAETHFVKEMLFNMASQKEQKHNLPHLNSLPVELEVLHASSSTLPNIGVDSIGKKVRPATDQACKEFTHLVASIENSRPGSTGFPATSQACKELDDIVRIVENERSGASGYLEAEKHCELEVLHASLSTLPNIGIDSIGKKVSPATDHACKELNHLVTSTENSRPGSTGFPATSQACKFDNIVRIVENQRSGASGYLEAEEHCDKLIKQSSQCNVEEGVNFYAAQVLILDNLEKDISPWDVIKIITDMTSLVVQVFIFPCPKSQRFTRGFVWFQDQASLLKAFYALLQDECFFIVSAKGRPWVVFITENEEGGSSTGILGAITVSSHSQEPSPSSGTLGEKKIFFVRKGTSQYEEAKQMKARFLEHLGLLHKRLEYEERTLSEL